jgi:hypothetical protein
VCKFALFKLSKVAIGPIGAHDSLFLVIRFFTMNDDRGVIAIRWAACADSIGSGHSWARVDQETRISDRGGKVLLVVSLVNLDRILKMRECGLQAAILVMRPNVMSG